MRPWLPIAALICGCAGGQGRDSGVVSGVGSSEGSDSGSGSSQGTTATATTGDSDPTMPSSGDTTADPSDGSSSDGSTTAADCTSMWRVSHAGELTDVAFDETSGTVFAIGTGDMGTTAWVLALDACDGNTLADAAFDDPAADTNRLDAVLVVDGALFVAGSGTYPANAREGLYAELDPVDLALDWSGPLYGSMGNDEVLELGASAGGALWMTGTSDYGAAGTAWVIAGTTDGSACGFPWGMLGSGSARAVAADGDEMVTAIAATDGTLALARWDSICTCGCVPTWSSPPIAIGTNSTAVGDLAVIDGQYYVAGWSSDMDDPSVVDAYVAWVSPTGVVAGTHTGALASAGGYLVMAADAERIYVGGAQGYDAGFLHASGVLRGIDLPFGADPPPAWSVQPDDFDWVAGIASEVASDGMLYVGGNIDGEAAIVRCDKQGGCG